MDLPNWGDLDDLRNTIICDISDEGDVDASLSAVFSQVLEEWQIPYEAGAVGVFNLDAGDHVRLWLDLLWAPHDQSSGEGVRIGTERLNQVDYSLFCAVNQDEDWVEFLFAINHTWVLCEFGDVAAGSALVPAGRLDYEVEQFLTDVLEGSVEV